MRIIARKTLNAFIALHPQSAQSLNAWFHEAKAAAWANSNELKQQYATASILKNGRVVFNIKGNDYRLVVRINYSTQIVYIRFVGTHKEYDTIDVNTV